MRHDRPKIRPLGHDWKYDEVASALRDQGLDVEVVGPGSETTFINPTDPPRSWRVAVFSTEEAADQFLARFRTHPANMTRRRNVLVTPTSSTGSPPPLVLAALESLDEH
jgi:hypothetical protein